MWQAAQAFAAWLTAQNGDHEDWHELSWLLLTGIPAIAELACSVAPSTSTDTLRSVPVLTTCAAPRGLSGCVVCHQPCNMFGELQRYLRQHCTLCIA